MSTASSIQKIVGKDGTQLMGSYSLYIGQLIVTLASEQKRDDPNYLVLACQILVFISIILARNYKNKKVSTVDKECQSEPGNGEPQELMTPF